MPSLNSPIVDTHAHLYMCEPAMELLLARASEAGVSHIVNVATDRTTTETVYQQSKFFPSTYPTAGIHPCYVKDAGSNDLAHLESWAPEKNIVAIGEIGLDYYWEPYDRELQTLFFKRQLDLAKQLNLPTIIHNRKADADIISIANAYPDVKKVFHCFSSGPTVYEQLAHPNHYFSFTGNITYSSKGKTIQAIKKMPLNHIMVETDAPYMTPKAMQGIKNEPAFVPEMVKKIADIKQHPIEDVAKQLYETSLAFFNLNR